MCVGNIQTCDPNNDSNYAQRRNKTNIYKLMFFYPKAEAKQSKFTKKIKQRRKEKHIYKKKEKEKNLQHDKKE